MGLLSPLLRSAADGRLTWWCPGCDGPHQIATGDGPGPRWSWNGDAARPTFTPSVLVTYEGKDADTPGGIPSCCHSFVVEGRMQFLNDCTHPLAGQTVPIPAWDEPPSASQEA